MRIKINKNNFSKTLFMVSSIAALIVFGVIYIFFISAVGFKQNEFNAGDIKQTDKYFINESYRDRDPYITKVPSLSDILAGPIISRNDPSLGSENSKVTIVVFSDFKCSFCKKQELQLKKIVNQFEGQVRLVWKDYPESNPESISYKAAIAGRCAQEQDMFWPYHDYLYANSESLNNEVFPKAAEAVNLDSNLFEKCLSNKAVEKLVNDNIEEANALDINGVPFIYVNDQEVMGEISYEELERLVNIELEK